jgi:glycosyltransferase involved in cell wall biosynthesis
VKVVALLAVRNEQRYLRRCLEHLFQQEIDTCVIDNESTDGTLAIAESFLNRGVIRIEHLAFSGAFELTAQLVCKERLAAEIEADWFIHQDADEIREAPKRYKTLREGIEAVDAAGYNAIDFDEFVFTPTSEDETFEDCDYVTAMRRYYYFEPDSPDRYRVNAWKKHPELDLHTLAGHKALFPGLRIAPEPFIMRHYMVLSRGHAIEKYAQRPFSPAERANSWHGDRASFRPDEFNFPPKDRLKQLSFEGEFDKSERWRHHPIFSRPASTKMRVISDRVQRIAVLREFKNRESEYIPTIDAVPEGIQRPFWSVMLPTYNADESHLIEALQSVLMQDPGSA